MFYNASLLSEKSLLVKIQYQDYGTGEGVITSDNFNQLHINLSFDAEGDDPLYNKKALDFALMVKKIITDIFGKHNPHRTFSRTRHAY